MIKNEFLGYAIMESAETVKPQNIQRLMNNGMLYVRFEVVLQSFNVYNRNRRLYDGDAMVKAFMAEHIAELEDGNSWCGEAGHPDTNDTKRILTIDPLKISHRIIKHTVTRQGCRAIIETLCNDIGTNMARLILQGMRVAFSLRALAPLVKSPDGSSMIKSPPHIVTYDWVILPSHKDAYMDLAKPIQTLVAGIEDGGNTMMESALIPVSESALQSLILTESTNVRLMSNVYGVLESFGISSDFKTCVITEGSTTYQVALEDKIGDDISRYMSSI